MKKPRSTTRAFAVAVAAAALAIAASTAVAEITVYQNDFSSRNEYRAIESSGGGKRCDRRYREKSKSMLASLARGPATCSFRPPVVGDRELPDHELRVDAKILKRTDSSVRDGAFIELSVRAGGGKTGYALRVIPKRKRFFLIRRPNGGGFPVQGKSKAINGINERNQLKLIARGAKVSGFVNGKEVAKVSDPDPGEVAGSKLRFAIGGQKDKRGKVAGTFKGASVAVPDP